MGVDLAPQSPTASGHPASNAGDLAQALGLLVDAVTEYAILMLDPAGTVMTWNSGAHRIKGYSAEEAIGQHFSVFYTATDIAAGKPRDELAHATEHGQCRDDGWRVRKDGELFWASVVITAVYDNDGRVAGFGKVTRDETDRRDSERQAQQLGRLADREAIGRGLSDTVVLGIFEAGLDLQAALRLLSDPDAIDRVEHAVEVLDQTVREIRHVVLRLDADDTSC